MKRKFDYKEVMEIVEKVNDAKKQEERTGFVAWYNELKNYGYITDSLTHEKLFVHVSNITCHRIQTGDRVVFKIGSYHDRPVAVEVTRI